MNLRVTHRDGFPRDEVFQIYTIAATSEMVPKQMVIATHGRRDDNIQHLELAYAAIGWILENGELKMTS
jgi:hypothetical protein